MVYKPAVYTTCCPSDTVVNEQELLLSVYSSVTKTQKFEHTFLGGGGTGLPGLAIAP